MNATRHADHDGHGGHGASDHGAGHVRGKDYVAGFVLAAALTALAFWLVIAHPLGTGPATAAAVMGLAVVQIVVHMVYFLHMNSRSEGGWTMLALLFTVLLLAIVLSGSMWVMHHLNVNMMPMSPQDARQAP
ncbi:MAG TPA: cytochrome o ubiquinol oxidase subunit IV [Phenylobacterium sp.]|jgi:cytochrome o ubiquinol oxidase operon protein cyoD|nr:cytochrome o ubiquinol oxidase subunit IV [Phenylobacterium sp.]